MKNIIVILGCILTLGIFIINSSATAGQRVKLFEMGESGQTVEFPMTPQEIAVEDAENDRLSALRESKLKKPKKRVVEFELAESGIIIEFPVDVDDISK
jgi:hypothetical protein